MRNYKNSRIVAEKIECCVVGIFLCADRVGARLPRPYIENLNRRACSNAGDLISEDLKFIFNTKYW